MPPLLSIREVTKSYSAYPLFDKLSLSVEPNERLGVIGPNGAGKSTLLRILAGAEQPDSGERVMQRGLALAYVTQVDRLPEETALAVAAAPLIAAGHDHHEAETTAEVALRAHGFPDPLVATASLSGGWKKRLSLVRALAGEPAVLLLDEPTNHLDPEGVWWLEATLARARFAVVCVSHDRWFLDRIATRVVEIDPRHAGGCFSAVGSYKQFLEHRDAYIASETTRQEALANQMRKETEWLRRQPKARTTKAEYRVKDAARLQAELSDVTRRNNMNRSMGLDFSATGRRSNDLIVAKGLAARYGERTIYAGVDVELGPGTRLGLLGLNGSGKSTLLRTLAGDRQPDAGTVKRLQDLRVVVFHQDRSRLRPNETLRQSLCPNGDTVKYRGSNIHVMSWAKRLLFRPDQLDATVGSLSGGEQARILLGMLMLTPADILLLDEPTNDLDIPALEVLEESLLEFPGAVVMVTHDRFLLDRVSTVLLALDGTGKAEYVADYAQWQTRQEERLAAAGTPVTASAGKPAKKGVSFSGKERRELENMEATIAKAEAAVAAIEAEIADPAVASDGVRLTAACEKLAKAQAVVEKTYARWQELEAKAAQAG